ncbi:cytosine-5-methyltransferase [Favolaschia claudopus]|uniref:Cytosine-specific methyltransferase n=1 Tax=Favolaschia claudopus TaxID=2862362 RepID=A0AAW0DB80_9AGAR
MVGSRPKPYVLVPPRKNLDRTASQPHPGPSRKRAAEEGPSDSSPPKKAKTGNVAAQPLATNSRDRTSSLVQEEEIFDTEEELDASVTISGDHAPSPGQEEEEQFQCAEEELELGDDDAKPKDRIRTLTNFSIYEGSHMVSANELLGEILSHSFTASGLAKRRFQDSDGSTNSEEGDDSEDDDFAQFVEDLDIIEFNIHHVENDEIDPDIYIRTKRSWYILDTPSPLYKPHFILLQLQHAYTHQIVLAAQRNGRTTLSKFIESLEAPLSAKELKSVEIVDYVQASLPAIAQDYRKRNILNAPLIKALQTAQFTEHLQIKGSVAFVTPVVGRVVTPHLSCKMTIIGQDSIAHDLPVDELLEDSDLSYHDEPTSMHFEDSLGKPGYYETAVIDGVKYHRGDIVSVNPGDDKDRQRAERAILSADFCRNSYARNVWFIQIQYFLNAKGSRGESVKKLHGIWLAHGSDTLLQEVNHSQELFVLDECEDIHVSSIFRKCNVRVLGPGEPEPPDVGSGESTSYFTRLCWDSEEYAFKDPPTLKERMRVIDLLDEHTPCVNCGFKAEEELRCKLEPLGPDIPNGFTQYGYDYHSGDFVYIKPEMALPSPLHIGQIIQIEGLTSGKLQERNIRCTIQYFERYTAESMDVQDERRLYRTCTIKRHRVKDLDGVCWVKHIPKDDSSAIEKWIDADLGLDRFYTNTCQERNGTIIPESELTFNTSTCHYCIEKHEQDAEAGGYDLRNGPIAALDVFAGAGGLSEGMRQTGSFETKWAIENQSSACKTFEANHPGATVMNADVNDVVKYIVDRKEGKATTPLRSASGHIIPDKDIPRPNEVDFIGGGSPCQPFSGLNHLRFKGEDLRTTLPFTMLGLVEILQPDYALLENVAGFMSFTLSRNERRIEMAAVKLFCRALMAIGYQVRFKVLQAGQYGAPQDRERLIFLAAKCGKKLPDFPRPTHAFQRVRKWKIPLRKRDRILPPTSSRTDGHDHRYAPHPPVTVKAAISDLPAFEWINPHTIIPKTKEDDMEQEERRRSGIKQCHVSTSPVGFLGPTAFVKCASTRFQRMMRRQDDLVDMHITPVFGSSFIESITMVPLRGWSNHRFLPPDLLRRRMKREEEKGVYFGRLHEDSYFMTAMTCLKPYKKNAYHLHPWCKRSLSLREMARAQGFRDGYALHSTASTPAKQLQDYLTQIGNAVPIPLAAALGRSIRAAAVHDWLDRLPKRRESSVVLD